MSRFEMLLVISMGCTAFESGDVLPDAGGPKDSSADAGAMDSQANDANDAEQEDSGAPDSGDAGCPAPAVDCGGRCIDCLGGTCSGGACTPVLFADVGFTAHALKRDGEYLYWATGQMIQRKAVSGGGIEDVLSTTVGVGDFSIVGPYLHWCGGTSQGQNGLVGEIDLSAQPIARRVLAMNELDPGAVISDGAVLYWQARGDFSLASMTLPSGPRRTLFRAVDLPSSSWIAYYISFARDASHLYWASEGTSVIVRLPSPATSTTPERFAPSAAIPAASVDFPGEILIEDAWLYWRNAARGGDVVRATVDGTQFEVLAGAPPTHTIQGFALHGSLLYWTELDDLLDGRVRVKDLSTGGIATAVASAPRAFYVVVDDAAIYYAAPDAIMRVAR